VETRQGGALVALALLAALATSCTPNPSSPQEAGEATDARANRVHMAAPGAPIQLAFVVNVPSEFWKIAEKGLEKARREHGIHIDMKQPPTGKVEEQKKILEDLVTQGYHGIAVSIISAEDEVRDINRAATRTNVITHDSDAPKSDRLAYIGTNNYEAGRRLGEEIVKLLPQGGKMAVFVGTLAADNARERLRGVEDVVVPKGIAIVAKKEDNKDRTKARTNAEDVISAYPDVNLLCGLWSYNGPAILAAVKAASKVGQLQIVGFDEEEETLAGIAEGAIACTCVQKPFEFGYRSAVLLHELATRGAEALPEDPIIDTGVEIIDSSNITDFRAQLAELKR
jgi:ribose transport system substrate-binding protein